VNCWNTGDEQTKTTLSLVNYKGPTVLLLASLDMLLMCLGDQLPTVSKSLMLSNA
jgi:hypothetical protein